MNRVEDALARIAARRPQVIDLSLDRVHAALSRLGDPHKRLPPVFHIAGTNGKGSTLAYLRAILEANGNSVHSFISPHLVRFNERIVLAGKEIGDDALLDIFEKVDDAVGDDKLTYFETTTCAAMLAYAQTPADFLLLEVGLGGRLDATNVIDKPLAAIVAPVDLDHQHFLGGTLELIASEKAGIFRAGAPAVIGRQDEAAMATLLAHAEEAGADIYAMGRDWDAYPERGRLIFQDEHGLLDLDPPKLTGGHQFDNAGLAIAASRAAGLKISEATLSAGLSAAQWPGRLQRLSSGPLVTLYTEHYESAPDIWLDGGHNPHAGRAVARAIADLEARAPRPLTLIAGMQANKDAIGYFENYAGLAKKVFAVAADHDGVASPQEVMDAASAAGLNAQISPSIEDAITNILAEHENEPPRILICGSLYLAGEVLKENN